MVSEAVSRANRETGQGCLYFPNFLPKREHFERSIQVCKNAGVRGLLVCPHLLGLDAVRYLREHESFILMLHPAFSGGLFTSATHGMRPSLVLGKLHRLLGGDASIYPNVGGRFIFDEATCLRINQELRRAYPKVKPAFPVPAGGLSAQTLPAARDAYGRDVIFLIGGGLMGLDSNLTKAVFKLKGYLEAQ